MIVQLNVEEGMRVQKGDVIAVLESTDYEADVARAKASVKLCEEKIRELENGSRPEQIKQAQAELAESQATLVQLQSEWRRNFELRQSKSITQQEYELAESSFKAMQQRVHRLTYALELLKLGERAERREVAKAELAQAQADLTKAEWRLGNCTIRARVSGTILKKAAEEGNIVNPLALNGSYSLCELADLSDLEVELNIQERDISAIKVGQKCRVRTKAWPDRVYEGVVSRLMPIADRGEGGCARPREAEHSRRRRRPVPQARNGSNRHVPQRPADIVTSPHQLTSSPTHHSPTHPLTTHSSLCPPCLPTTSFFASMGSTNTSAAAASGSTCSMASTWKSRKGSISA